MSALLPDHSARVARARLALEGLSLGDAFGERFFGEPEHVAAAIAARSVPRSPWNYTDDTVMALSVFEVLERRGCIDQDTLARAFGAKYFADPLRGYGAGAHLVLQAIGRGGDWRHASRASFGGVGSFGNGGAMRVAPVGAYFADDLQRCASEAARCAEVTHAHLEGRAGAIAVAIATACCASGRVAPGEIFAAVLAHTPQGDTRRGIEAARDVTSTAGVKSAADLLGNGSAVTAQDTVPLVIWSIARQPRDFVEAMWTTVSALGDRDTTCAMVGGAVALTEHGGTIPAAWLRAREPLSTFAKLGVED